MNRLGYIPDNLDRRDASFLRSPLLKGKPPEYASAMHLCPPVMNQGGIGSCVANATAVALYAAHKRAGAAKPELASRLFVYWCARYFDGLTEVDSGTKIRNAFRGLNKWGFCPESKWTYSDSEFPPKYARHPSPTAIRAAFDQRHPTSYRRIYGTGADRIDQVKRAIAAKLPVVFGTAVGESFANGSVDTLRPVGIPTDQIVGKHAMAIVAYDGDRFVAQNSWGTLWGERGFVTLTREYIEWDESQDFWVADSAPHYS